MQFRLEIYENGGLVLSEDERKEMYLARLSDDQMGFDDKGHILKVKLQSRNKVMQREQSMHCTNFTINTGKYFGNKEVGRTLINKITR